MLMPKRVKRRRVHRGRMKGVATKGNLVTYGEYGLAACQPGWITSNQIEAARIVLSKQVRNWKGLDQNISSQTGNQEARRNPYG